MGYAQVVSGDNPLHYWRLADAALSGIGNDLATPSRILVGQTGAVVWYPIVGYTGPSSDGGAAEFPNQTAYSTGGALLQQGAAGFSIEAWCWLLSSPAAAAMLVAWDYDTNPSQGLGLNGTGKGIAWDGGNDANGATAVPIQSWHHLVGVWSTTTGVKVYLDGAQDGANAVNAVVNHNLQVFVARTRLGAQVFSHFVSEVAIYNYALSATQIAAHYAAADNRSQPPVFGGAGSGASSGAGGGSLEQQILASVRKVY